MMGERRQRDSKLFHYGFSLEARIPEDHILRKISRVVDFSFVRNAVADRYGDNGHESEDPIVLLKLMFLLFFEDVSSERELVRTLPFRMDWLWFCNYDIDDEIPNHSILSKARRRWGKEVFEELFVRILRQCVDAGLVDGHKIYIDSTQVVADASLASIEKGPKDIIDQLKQIYGATEKRLDDSAFYPRSYTKKSDTQVSKTDPDANMARSKASAPAKLSYKHHRVVDDKTGVITAIETTHSEVADGEMVEELTSQHERHVEKSAETIVADKKYGTTKNFVWCGQKGIKAHMVDLHKSYLNKEGKPKLLSIDAFQYDAVTDTFTCPADQIMRRRRTPQEDYWQYLVGKNGKTCEQCSLKSQCSTAKSGRILKRHLQQELLDQARSQSETPEAYQDRRRRKHLIEGSFADAANNHHLKRARWRRLWRQQIQGYLIASCQNLRLLLTRKGPLARQGEKSPAVASIADSLQLLNQKILASFRPVSLTLLKTA